MVYLIHFDEKLSHAQHYLGFVDGGVERLASRLEYHRKGQGSKLLRAVVKKGINFSVVRTWEQGDRNFERSLKNRKNASGLCPVCKKIKQEKLQSEKSLVLLQSHKKMKKTTDIIVAGKEEAEERNATVAKLV